MEKPEKKPLHPRNKHRYGYDFDELTRCCPELKPFVIKNKVNNKSIDFSNPKAVKLLNKALLILHYSIEHWDIPDGYLCPAVPSRADYIHYLADLLNEGNPHNIRGAKTIRILDIGIGANCIYPIIGSQDYGWNFVGSEVNPQAFKAASAIVKYNTTLSNKVECRLQVDSNFILKGIIKNSDSFEATICNPPFYESETVAQKTNQQKNKHLKLNKGKHQLNFGGKKTELVYEGGEVVFIQKMIAESCLFKEHVKWFTTLVSKKVNLPVIYKKLDKLGIKNVKTIEMTQGQKQSRFVAWRFE